VVALRDSTGQGCGLLWTGAEEPSALLRSPRLRAEEKLFLPTSLLPPVRSRSSVSPRAGMNPCLITSPKERSMSFLFWPYLYIIVLILILVSFFGPGNHRLRIHFKPARRTSPKENLIRSGWIRWRWPIRLKNIRDPDLLPLRKFFNLYLDQAAIAGECPGRRHSIPR
jgi:hypothetical protein